MDAERMGMADGWRSQSRFMKVAILAFAIGYALHSADHFGRGIDATPPLVFVIGVLLWVVAVYWIWRMLLGDARAPLYAMYAALANAIGSIVVHIPQYWGGGVYSMPYPGHANAVQWFALAASVFGSLVLVVACA